MVLELSFKEKIILAIWKRNNSVMQSTNSWSGKDSETTLKNKIIIRDNVIDEKKNNEYFNAHCIDALSYQFVRSGQMECNLSNIYRPI